MARFLSVIFVLLAVPLQSGNRVVSVHIADFTFAENVSISPGDQQVLREAMTTSIDQSKKVRVVADSAADYRLTVTIIQAYTVAETGAHHNWVAMRMVVDLEVTDLKAQRTLGKKQVKETVGKELKNADQVYPELTKKIGKKVAKFLQSVAK